MVVHKRGYWISNWNLYGENLTVSGIIRRLWWVISGRHFISVIIIIMMSLKETIVNKIHAPYFMTIVLTILCYHLIETRASSVTESGT